MFASSPPRSEPASGSDAQNDVRWARGRPSLAHWIGGIVLVVVVVQLTIFFAANPNLEWTIVWRYLFDPSLLKGLQVTLTLTVTAMTVGILIGWVAALMRLSGFRLFSLSASLYLWIFRSVPALVQILFWFNLAYLLPTVKIGLPFGAVLFEAPTNQVVSAFTAAVLALGLHEGAYMAEIFRAGILSVPIGQREAARVLGLTRRQEILGIVLPQSLRFIVPPTGSQVISMLKGTSLISAIALGELLYSAQAIYNRTFEVIPLLMVVCFWYMAIVGLLSMAQSGLERHFNRGHQR